jgi:allophanate hydrolase subunit 2
VRTDSDRVGVRLDGPALPVPEGAGSVPSEPMLPGAIQVPPSGLPVVFGPDHPTTGGYPVIAVVTRRGLDRLAQAGAGTTLRFVEAEEAGADGTRWSPPG